MIALVVRPSIYGQIRNKIDAVQNANVSCDWRIGVFHELWFSSVYLPATVDYLVMAKVQLHNQLN